MNRERAETHLRLLAEEDLRRATTQPSDGTSGMSTPKMRQCVLPASPEPWQAALPCRMPSWHHAGDGAPVVRPGAVLGGVSSAWTAGPAAVAAIGVSVTAWPGAPVTDHGEPRPLGHAISRGQPVAQATVTIGSDVRRFTLVARRAVPAPSARWLLTRL